MMEEVIIERYVKDFKDACCPFGYSDIYAAVRHAIAIGEDGDWLFELVQEQAEEIGMPFGKMDIVYTVLDHILQMSRNEIDELTGVDILDYNYAEYPVVIHSNYMMSEYLDTKETAEVLADLFSKEGITQDKLSQVTLYFLEQIEFDWTKVSPYTKKD